MLAVQPNRFGWMYTNADAASGTPGTAVASNGTADVEGAWIQIATSGNIANEVWLLVIGVWAIANAVTARRAHIDVGIDPAGGSSYTPIIENLLCGQAGTFAQGGAYFHFPIRIPSGSSVAVRHQNSSVSISARVAGWFFGKPSHPEVVWRGQVCETIGSSGTTGGTSFTPGNGAEGSRVSLGTVTRAAKWFQLGVQINNTVVATDAHHIDLDWSDDATNYFPIITNMPLNIPTTNETVARSAAHNLLNCHADVPAGATLYVRGWSSAAPPTGFQALAYAVS